MSPKRAAKVPLKPVYTNNFDATFVVPSVGPANGMCKPALMSMQFGRNFSVKLSPQVPNLRRKQHHICLQGMCNARYKTSVHFMCFIKILANVAIKSSSNRAEIAASCKGERGI